MPEQPKKLRKLVVDRVDLCDQGSNPDAHIALFKRDAEAVVAKIDFDTLIDWQKMDQTISEICSLTYTLAEALSSARWTDDAASEVKRSIKQFSSAVDEKLGAFAKTEVEKVAAQSIRKSVDSLIASIEEKNSMSQKIDKSKLDDATRAYIEELEGKVAKTTEEPKKEEVSEDVLKTLPEPIRKRLEESEAIAKQAKEQAAKAEADLAVEKSAREFETIKKRVENEYPNLPGTLDEKAAAIQKAEATGDKTLMAMLRAGEAAAGNQLLQKGEKTTQHVSGGAFDQLIQKRDALMKTETSLTKEQAMLKVCQQNPELYKRYKNGE